MKQTIVFAGKVDLCVRGLMMDMDLHVESKFDVNMMDYLKVLLGTDGVEIIEDDGVMSIGSAIVVADIGAEVYYVVAPSYTSFMVAVATFFSE